MNPLIIADANGNLWQLGNDSQGRLTATLVTSGTPQTVVLQSPGGFAFQVVVLTAPPGMIQTVPYSGPQPAAKSVSLGNGYKLFLANDLGQLATAPCGNDWKLGTLYDPHFNGIRWSQPDGPFTKVLPVTQVQAQSNLLTNTPFSELTGTYMFGCGHSVDQVLLLMDFDFCSQEQVALICCPTCSFLSRVIVPWSQAYNPIQQAVLTP